MDDDTTQQPRRRDVLVRLDPEVIERLATGVERLNNHRFVRTHNSILALMWYQFMRGLAFGLGTVIGATILVSVVVLFLSQIEFVPIIGEWAGQIIDEIEDRFPVQVSPAPDPDR